MNYFVLLGILYSAQFVCFLALFFLYYCKVTVQTLHYFLQMNKHFIFSFGKFSVLMYDERNILCLKILSTMSIDAIKHVLH